MNKVGRVPSLPFLFVTLMTVSGQRFLSFAFIHLAFIYDLMNDIPLLYKMISF